jgi:hypothetical protein
MTPQQFYKDVAELNVAEFRRSPNDIRLACNAVMSIDAFLGLHWAATNPGQRGDDAYKETVARNSECYRAVRDLAYALKHGELTGSSPRLVRTVSEVSTADRIMRDHHIWSDSDILTDFIVVVQTPKMECSATKLVELALRAAYAASLGETVPTDTLLEAGN